MKKPVIVVLHIVYWLLYLLLISLFFALMTMGNNYAERNFAYYAFLMLQFALLPALLSFYAFYTFLFNRFLSSRKILYLVIFSLVVAGLAAGIGEVFLYFSYKWRIQWSAETVITMGVIMAFNALLNGLIGLGLKSFIVWYRDLKWKEAISQKNHEMEMALVRSQINPHFLFNTINNIDVLIEKDAVRASSYLNRLSDIMRFTLYETRAESIPLERELEYIGKYIELQKIRTTNPDYVHYVVTGMPAGKIIAPMLFIPFIENAFKHAASKRTENVVDIHIAIEQRRLIFECSNSYVVGAGMEDEHSGLGNELILKRLSLIYPDQHQLTITDIGDVYTIKLIVELK